MRQSCIGRKKTTQNCLKSAAADTLDLARIPGNILEWAWDRSLDQQQSSPLTVPNSDVEITSLMCAQTSSQDNLGQEFALFDFGQDILNQFIEDVNPSCAEHLTSHLDDASVFQNLEYFISDSKTPLGHSCEMASTNASETTILEEVPIASSVSTTVNEKLLENEKQLELQLQENNLMDYFSSTAEQLAHYEEFHDLNQLLEQVEMHEILETVHVSSENVIGQSDVESHSIPSVSSELQSSEDFSLEPPNKKQKRIPATLNESTCEVSSTKTERTSNLTPETTHQKYMEMRRKNNIASKRSRQIRKEKDKANEIQVTELENENRVLKERAERLEKQRDKLKNYLMTLLTKS